MIYKLILVLVAMVSSATTQSQDWRFVPFSTTTISLDIKYDPTDTVLIEAKSNTIIPRDFTRSNFLMVNKAGQYHLNLLIDRPNKAILQIGDESFNVFVSPNDTSALTVARELGHLHFTFSGKTKIINQYYLDKRHFFDGPYIQVPITSASTYDGYKNLRDSITNLELEYLYKYQTSTVLPQKFIEYEQSEIVYDGAGGKTALPLTNEILNIFDDQLGADYFDYLRNVKINNNGAIFSFNYAQFLDDYFLRSLSANAFDHLRGYDRAALTINHNVAQAKEELIGLSRDTYLLYNFCSLLPYSSDFGEIDSLASAFGIANYQALLPLAGSKSKSDLKMLNLNNGEIIPDFTVVDELDSMRSITEFSDRILYINFWATWCGPCIQNFPALNEMIAHYNENSDIEFINICLDSPKERWVAALSRYKLKGINLFAEGNWSKKIRSYFNIEGIPHYAIIDRRNILLENFCEKAPQIKQRIEQLLRHETKSMLLQD